MPLVLQTAIYPGLRLATPLQNHPGFAWGILCIPDPKSFANGSTVVKWFLSRASGHTHLLEERCIRFFRWATESHRTFPGIVSQPMG